MKVVLQRVNHSSVVVDGETVGQIGKGYLLLVGFGRGDDSSKLKPMAEKIINLRLFPDGDKKLHLTLIDIQGEVLLVPQFTLFADISKGRRPEFFGALEPDKATLLFDQFTAICKELGVAKVETGRFGAYMKVALENDGPVTITLES
ncbi:MAG: D-tyrosyl-tRNA(Tyr) deacylase [Proteobacteria bacterium]|nr:MAG: D-tyrosyl-tRNA(Tyr) deacylase [Pseudomonadota bacterium]